MHFLTSLCAIVGGVFTGSRSLSSFLFVLLQPRQRDFLMYCCTSDWLSSGRDDRWCDPSLHSNVAQESAWQARLRRGMTSCSCSFARDHTFTQKLPKDCSLFYFHNYKKALSLNIDIYYWSQQMFCKCWRRGGITARRRVGVIL